MTPAGSAPHGGDWLSETRQLDISHPKLRITAQKLTQARQTPAARAAAIHDFVRRMPFRASPASSSMRASEVLLGGAGDCHSKGVLFAALCRAAGLPARLLIVDVRPRFLQGLLARHPDTMVHVVGQVMVDGRWLATDGYVVDPPLFAQAKHRLRRAGRDCGWGIVRGAQGLWDGQRDCLHQFGPADVSRTRGVFDEPMQFYRRGRAGPRGWFGALAHAAGVHLLNRRVRTVREGAPVLPGPQDSDSLNLTLERFP